MCTSPQNRENHVFLADMKVKVPQGHKGATDHVWIHLHGLLTCGVDYERMTWNMEILQKELKIASVEISLPGQRKHSAITLELVQKRKGV